MRHAILLSSAIQEKQETEEEAIKDQEALGFGSFRQMNKDIDPWSVSVSAELQQDEEVWHVWFRSSCTACQDLATVNILLVLVSWSLY